MDAQHFLEVFYPQTQEARRIFEQISHLDPEQRTDRVAQITSEGIRDKVESLIAVSTCTSCGRIKSCPDGLCEHCNPIDMNCFDLVGRPMPSGRGWTKQEGLFE